MKRRYGYIASIVVASVLVIMPAGAAIATAPTEMSLDLDADFDMPFSPPLPELRLETVEQLDSLLKELSELQQRVTEVEVPQAKRRGGKFACTECSATFDRRDRLLAHETCHTGVKPFPCDMCNGEFSRKDRFNTHRKLHFAPSPFQCENCKTSFTQRWHLKKHRNKNTCKKPRTTTQVPSLELA